MILQKWRQTFPSRREIIRSELATFFREFEFECCFQAKWLGTRMCVWVDYDRVRHRGVLKITTHSGILIGQDAANICLQLVVPSHPVLILAEDTTSEDGTLVFYVRNDWDQALRFQFPSTLSA